MSFTTVGLNLAAISMVEPLFYVKQAVRFNAQSTPKSPEDPTIQHQDVIKLYSFDFFPSNKLLTWAPQLVSEPVVMNLDNDTAGKCDTLINAPSDSDESMISIEVFTSPASSPSAQSVSCYSCESEEERNSNASESSFSSFLEEDSINHSVMSQNLVTLPLSVSLPHHKPTVASTNELLPEPIVSQNCSWQEEINHLSTDEEWGDYINELAEELERDFRCNFEFLSNEGEVKARHVKGSISSSRRQSEDFDKFFDSLFDDDSSILESEDLDEIEQIAEGRNTQPDIIKLSDQEVPRCSLTSAERHARALQLNPHLSHLFD